MNTVIVTDVFGKTSALISLANELNTVEIIDPYDGIDMGFENEGEAYSYFMASVGLDGYLEKSIKQIEVYNARVTLIGFSVGASVVWRLSETTTSDFVDRAVCFYGSQIRYFTAIEPKFKIELVFPFTEPHFDVYELQDILSKKTNITANRVSYLHGFMNFNSNKYD